MHERLSFEGTSRRIKIEGTCDRLKREIAYQEMDGEEYVWQKKSMVSKWTYKKSQNKSSMYEE
jgi:hypothetical protein